MMGQFFLSLFFLKAYKVYPLNSFPDISRILSVCLSASHSVRENASCNDGWAKGLMNECMDWQEDWDEAARMF